MITMSILWEFVIDLFTIDREQSNERRSSRVTMTHDIQ
jgi:hypothetical protein